MSRITSVALVVIGIAVCTAADAAERKAYKYVDEKGNVVYSQTPPVNDKGAEKIDISPAQSGRGGNASTYSPYDNPRTYSTDRQRQEYNDALRASQKRQEEARAKRLAELEAECNRNRGTDCKNSQTLRTLEAQQIPGGYRR